MKPNIEIIRRSLKPFIKEILGELAIPSGANPEQTVIPTTTTDVPSQSDVLKQQRDQKLQQDTDLKDKKKELDLLKKRKEVDTKINMQKISNAEKAVAAMKK